MGTFKRIKIGILSSSRADYGVYLPLIRKLHNDPFFNVEIIAFGSHLNERYGHTVELIIQDGFHVLEVNDTLNVGDSPSDIVKSMAKTMQSFSYFLSKTQYHLLFALGDRYEMFAAVAATVPFNIIVAHIHGGETTLGSIDNSFRHSITSFSSLHFASTVIYKRRITEIKGCMDNIFDVGALSIDNLKKMKFYTIAEFRNIYGINLNNPSILITFHPETINYERNKNHINELIKALKQINHYQLIITMPNADTRGQIIREQLKKFASDSPNAFLIESFGSKGYLSAMKYCSFMLGNTSSGFVEASFFPKIVINIGERQKGRILTDNIISTRNNSKDILESVVRAEKMKIPTLSNLYGDGDAAGKIISIIKKKYKDQ